MCLCAVLSEIVVFFSDSLIFFLLTCLLICKGIGEKKTLALT
jgi:hypothetical protein